MNCVHCGRTASAACRFCGRAVCNEHTQTRPYIVALYTGANGEIKAVVVPDAVYCGRCNPREQPVSLPELK